MKLPKTATVSNLYGLQSGTTLHRVHDERFEADAFNPCEGAKTRFTHLHDKDGKCIPTAYAATTLDGAAFETIFRGIPDRYQAMPRQMLEDRMVSAVQPVRPFRLIPLFTPELRAWDLDQGLVFTPSAESYGFCRKLGFLAWRDNPDADGLIWASVQDSGAHAMLLFGDRIAAADIEIVSTRSVRTDPTALNDLVSAGDRGGWTISK